MNHDFYCPTCRVLVPWYAVLQLPDRPGFHFVATAVSHQLREVSVLSLRALWFGEKI